MTVKKLKSIPKLMFPQIKMVAEECCCQQITGTLNEANFYFRSKENAEFFSKMLKSLTVFENKFNC